MIKDVQIIENDYIEMHEMEPCEFGIISDSDSYFNGDIVLRTRNMNHFEVMNLSKSKSEGWFSSITESKQFNKKVKPIKNAKIEILV